MPQLLNLPNELLFQISEYVSATDRRALFKLVGVNRRLNRVAAPLLVRRWPWMVDWEDIFIDPFALYLLRHPELRRQVRRLKLLATVGWDDRNRSLRRPKIGPDELVELSTAAAQAWPALDDCINWTEQIRSGYMDAIAALVLAWAKDLTHLYMTLLRPERLTIFILASQVARRLLHARGPQEPQSEPLPLMKLQHVYYGYRDTVHGVDGQYAAPFFYLPSMQTFAGYRVWRSLPRQRGEAADAHLDVEPGTCLTEFPQGTSTIQEIVLENSCVSAAYLSQVVRSCRRLRELSLELIFDYYPDDDDMTASGLAPSILHHAASLEVLHISWNDPYGDFMDRDADGSNALEECLRHLTCLEDLSIPSHLLFSTHQEQGRHRCRIETSRLPRSIKRLKLEGSPVEIMWTGEPGLPESLMDVAEGFEVLLRKSGPDGEFPNLSKLETPLFLPDSLEGDVVAARLRAAATATGVDIDLASH
ncbi:hypothetical protein ACRE_082270 [Hapsidospora chrysogenum ATCC 11550]|uniref:F-box domain-containing protein n=1 Tax=Hapsidospora chrysogenum (strain ATCC 11550 / CBS 779.69 / DSM 880 / IAM 14645 / JCM 23072 / IMI 49137) TaxID=857340 RepID=A0A086SVD6_HAPC1|nr:hypothetical protein ACRE_082270 [Hapsidospora chrysogenum ATCC 11550]